VATYSARTICVTLSVLYIHVGCLIYINPQGFRFPISRSTSIARLRHDNPASSTSRSAPRQALPAGCCRS